MSNVTCRLSHREKKRRKLVKEGESVEKPDRLYTTTIMMLASIAMTFPYDMPPFLPTVLSALVKHLQTPSLKDTVARAIQDFKRTHQDRWEDFKALFTHDQLADLQGAGAAHYFS